MPEKKVNGFILAKSFSDFGIETIDGKLYPTKDAAREGFDSWNRSHPIKKVKQAMILGVTVKSIEETVIAAE